MTILLIMYDAKKKPMEEKMNKVISVIRSAGNFDDKKGNVISYDNIIINLDSGSRLYTNETLLCGEGKPMSVKVKYEDWQRLCKYDPKDLLGHEAHFYSENNQIVQISIK